VPLKKFLLILYHSKITKKPLFCIFQEHLIWFYNQEQLQFILLLLIYF